MAKNVYIPIVSKFDNKGVQAATGSLDGLGKTLGKFAGVLAAAFSVKAIVDFTKESILAAEAIQTSGARIQNIAESMGVFGAEADAVTQRLKDYADANEQVLATDENVIMQTQAKLLTFAELAKTADETGGSFDRATAAAIDLAAAGFGSAETNAVQLGKALQDPLKGITALTRSGVTFTDAEKEKIATLVESGQMLEAQNVILSAVETQVGGTAAATADASVKMGLAFAEIKEQVGAALLPVFEQLAPVLIQFASTVGPILAQAFEALTPVLTQIVEMLPGILNSFMPLIPVVGELAGIFLNLAAMVLPIFANLLTTLAPIILTIANAFLQFITAVLDPILPLIDQLITVFGQVISAILPPLIDLVLALVPVFMQFVMQVITPLIPLVMKLVAAFLPVIMQIFPQLAALVAQVLPLLMNLFTSVLMPLIPVIVDLALAFLPLVSQILPLFIQVASLLLPPLLQIVQLALTPLIEAIQFLAPIVIFLVEGALSYLGFYIENILMPIFQGIADFLNAILPPIIEAIQDYFGDLGEKFAEVGAWLEEVWGGVGDFFRDIANNMIGFFEGFINFVIDGINGFLKFLDDMGQTLKDLTGGTIGWDIETRVNKVSLPRLADGGIVMPQTGGVLAMLAEAGQPEAVIPLDRLGEFGGGGNVVNVTINAGIGTDPVSLGRTVVNAIKRYEATSGRVFLNV